MDTLQRLMESDPEHKNVKAKAEEFLKSMNGFPTWKAKAVIAEMTALLDMRTSIVMPNAIDQSPE